jgi:hypothetical protein
MGEEPCVTYLNAAPDELIPVFVPENINIVVVGGSSNGQWSSFHGRPLDPRWRRAPTDRTTLSVDAWR